MSTSTIGSDAAGPTISPLVGSIGYTQNPDNPDEEADLAAFEVLLERFDPVATRMEAWVAANCPGFEPN
jgi:hypothetical protein